MNYTEFGLKFAFKFMLLTKAKTFSHVAVIVNLMYGLFISLPEQLYRLRTIVRLTRILKK